MRSIPITVSLLCLGLASCAGRNNGPIRASGTIEAVAVNVAAKTGGQILSFRVEQGSAVKPGDTVAVIDHAVLELQLRQALAGVTLASIQLDNDHRDRRRTETLLASGSATQKQRDDAVARFKGSQARHEQAQATADLIRKAITDCYVTSPAKGVVTTKAFEAGEMAAPGAALLTVSKLDRVDLVIYVTERELARVKPNQRADVSIDAFRDKTYPGTVVFISPEAEFTPKNVQTREDRVKQVFAVKIEIDNRDLELKPGLPADAVIGIE